MADESQVSTDVLEPTSNNGQLGQANESKDLGPSGGQTSDNGKAAQDTNIRNLQSTYDKKLAEQQRQLQQSQYAFQQIQQRLQQMEDNAAPDDYARLELRAKRAEEAAQYYAKAHQDAIAAQQADLEKQRVLRELAEEL